MTIRLTDAQVKLAVESTGDLDTFFGFPLHAQDRAEIEAGRDAWCPHCGRFDGGHDAGHNCAETSGREDKEIK